MPKSTEEREAEFYRDLLAKCGNDREKLAQFLARTIHVPIRDIRAALAKVLDR